MGHKFKYTRVVVKLGTNLLTTSEGGVSASLIKRIAGQIAAMRASGVDVALVSSGSITAGHQVFSYKRVAAQETREVVRRQALAALGQPRLMAVYAEQFSKHDIVVAQALISRSDLKQRVSYLNARDTLNALFRIGALPIINENDVVSTREIVGKIYGDNDRLAAMVANAVDADLLILLGEMDGLYERDPHLDPGAKLLTEVPEITPEIERIAGKPRDRSGSGGMASKLQAAQLATGSGITMVIASGRVEQVMERICAGERLGTIFKPQISHVEARKRWMMTGFTERSGCIHVDSGAATALQKRGVSLLPAGISAVEGIFARGDIVSVCDPKGKVVAFGLVSYKSSDLELVKGLNSGAMEERLAHFYGVEAIHRNNLALV